jgi:sporulation protein YlmC with PRC-barrel domain
MQLSDLLGLPVCDSDGTTLGALIDVRLSVSGDMDDRPNPPKVFGIIVSPHSSSSYLGYERRRVDSPRVLASLLRWRHRGTFLALWSDVDDVDRRRVTLRRGATKYSPVLNEE